MKKAFVLLLCTSTLCAQNNAQSSSAKEALLIANGDYAHVWLGFSGVELHAMLEKVGFRDPEVSVVAREQQAPNFQTILATGIKGDNQEPLQSH